jgi:hypothetical protein
MGIEAMTKIDNLKAWTSGVDVDWESISKSTSVCGCG